MESRSLTKGLSLVLLWDNSFTNGCEDVTFYKDSQRRQCRKIRDFLENELKELKDKKINFYIK
ncbi:hypothetical protein PR048_016925 [Dryococelus australis]|uniref:Uncharacterized protein n=1 Tax=Dryococelus australis TaxID=614101 RepID=A0ABQ9H828_9NEOP|nr:hypothetical protein PR048_016925 [Dryococelus australis]